MSLSFITFQTTERLDGTLSNLTISNVPSFTFDNSTMTCPIMIPKGVNSNPAAMGLNSRFTATELIADSGVSIANDQFTLKFAPGEVKTVKIASTP